MVGLDETAQVLKCEASLADPKPEGTPGTPETPSMSRFPFSDPGTPTEKVREVFEENYARDRVVWRTDTLDSSPCPGSQLVYFTLCLAHRSSKECRLVV